VHLWPGAPHAPVVSSGALGMDGGVESEDAKKEPMRCDATDEVLCKLNGWSDGGEWTQDSHSYRRVRCMYPRLPAPILNPALRHYAVNPRPHGHIDAHDGVASHIHMHAYSPHRPHMTASRNYTSTPAGRDGLMCG